VDAPLDGLFWAAGYSFSRADVIQDVPYDPSLKFLFFGEVCSRVPMIQTHSWRLLLVHMRHSYAFAYIIPHIHMGLLVHTSTHDYQPRQSHTSSQPPYIHTSKLTTNQQEMGMAARLYTHGYDLYAPSKTVIFHLWSRRHRPSFFAQVPDTNNVRDTHNSARHKTMYVTHTIVPDTNNVRPIKYACIYANCM
jgi:hypothetical protein